MIVILCKMYRDNPDQTLDGADQHMVLSSDIWAPAALACAGLSGTVQEGILLMQSTSFDFHLC